MPHEIFDLTRRDNVRELGAFLIAALALLLSVASVGDANSAEASARNNLVATDAFAWFQAKNIRQTSYELARDELGTTIATERATLPPDTAARLESRLAFYEAQIARYEDEPDPDDPENPLKGEGMTQLLARAEHYKAESEEAHHRNASFDYAIVMAATGIVIASAGVMIASPRFLASAVALGVIGVLFLVNAMGGFVDLSFGVG